MCDGKRCKTPGEMLYCGFDLCPQCLRKVSQAWDEDTDRTPDRALQEVIPQQTYKEAQNEQTQR